MERLIDVAENEKLQLTTERGALSCWQCLLSSLYHSFDLVFDITSHLLHILSVAVFQRRERTIVLELLFSLNKTFDNTELQGPENQAVSH